MSVPSMTMLPLSGLSSPISALRKTDLPVPDGPSITQISPAGMVRVTSPQMSCLPKDLVRSSTLISTPTDAPPLLCHWLDTPNPRARDGLRCAQTYQRVNKREVTGRSVTCDTRCHSKFQQLRGGEGTRPAARVSVLTPLAEPSAAARHAGETADQVTGRRNGETAALPWGGESRRSTVVLGWCW